MLNQLVIIGRLVSDPEVTESQDERKESKVVIAVPRSFKNENGEFETDFISCILYNGIAENTAQYCHKGDLIGVKGRVQGNEETGLQLIAEKITFLSSKSSESQE